MSWQLSFKASGDNFYPSRVDLPLVSSNDPGEIASYGRYKGQPLQFGRATFVPPESLNGHKSLESFCHLVAEIIPALRNAGADEFILWIIRNYDNQCNEELSAAELALISSLNCTLCYTAYQTDNDDT